MNTKSFAVIALLASATVIAAGCVTTTDTTTDTTVLTGTVVETTTTTTETTMPTDTGSMEATVDAIANEVMGGTGTAQ